MEIASLSSGLLFLAIVMPVIIAGLLHLLIIRFNLFASLCIPLDGGAIYREKRVFGRHKTVRGLLVMTMCTAAAFAGMQMLVFNRYEIATLFEGGLLGMGYIFSELPNSFIKRQRGIGEGRTRRGIPCLIQYFIDQIDSVIGVTIIAAVVFGLNLNSVVFLLVTGTLVHIVVDFLAHELRWKRRTAPLKRYILSQIFVFCCCKVIFKCLNSTSAHGLGHLDDLDEELPIVIAANHRNRYDSYIIAGAMPWKYFRRLMPKRYMTAAKYMDQFGLGQFLLFCGAYSTAVTDEETHYRSKDMLRRGETIMIYPEGKMTERIEGWQKGKVGALWMARAVEETHILPVKIESNLRIPIGSIFRGGQKFKVTFGPMYRPKQFEEDLQPQVNELMDIIYSLS